MTVPGRTPEWEAEHFARETAEDCPVTGCGDCPMRMPSTDGSWAGFFCGAVGDDSGYNYIGRIYDGETTETPTWCPLLKSPMLVRMKR